jgi:aminoglycoside phosphotransferase (APT) family kinase protein
MSEPSCENDCHRVRDEYPVVRAAYRRGFPAPEALWLDTEHELLPGGDFIVMRCAPGRTGGNVFRATTRLSTALIDVLADGMVRLHTLPPLLELGDHTDSIRTDLWGLSRSDCVRRYIQGWHDLYLRTAHNPSPVLMSLYGWLFDNIPESPGTPVLLHGDIGFHNMLIDEGRLSALVDWEFAHIGDPAEDVGYVKNTSGGMDWEAFMARYRAAGGEEIDPVRLHFFQVWGQVRNASASNVTTGKFAEGRIPDLKLAYTGHFHYPHFIRGACDLVEAGPGKATKSVGY